MVSGGGGKEEMGRRWGWRGWGGGRREVEGGWGAAMTGSNLTNGVADVVDGHFVSVTSGYLFERQ